MSRPLTISFGGKHLAKVVKTAHLDWADFSTRLSVKPPEEEDKASIGWYCPTEFSPEYRDGKNFVARHALTFDYDKIDIFDLEEIKDAYRDLAYCMYTTASHTENAPRIRVVFPLSRPVDKGEFAAITRKIADKFDITKLAKESDVPAQMMFLPTVKPDGQFWSLVNEGDWINVDEILGEYDDWTDAGQWPTRGREDRPVHGNTGVPPDEKLGVVGDFCRTFTVPEAISRFALPYATGSSDGRYTFTRGSRPDGLRIYDNGLKGHSDHDTDPAYGQHNAFDLTRLHLYGELDDGAADGCSITQLPSYKAMCKLALEQPELVAQRATDDFDVVTDVITEPVKGNGADVKLSESIEPEKEVDRPRFQVVSPDEFASSDPEKWLMKGVLPRAELAVLFGDAGSGKSFLALDWCGAICRGENWNGRTVAKGKCVYVCAEGAGGFKRRLVAYAQEQDIELKVLPGVIPEAPNFLETADAVDVTKAIREYGGADLVIIDTLSAATPGGNENSGEDIGKVIDHCKKLHHFTDALVLLIHHSGKDASRGARGWSGLRAAADAEIEVTRNGDFRTASITKMKDGSDGDKFVFKLKTVVIGVDEDVDEITSCVLEHVDAPAPARTKAPTGMYAKTALRVARELLGDGSSIYNEQLIAAAAVEMPKISDDKRDTRRQQMGRAIQKLVDEGYLFMHGEDKVALTTAGEVGEEDWND